MDRKWKNEIERFAGKSAQRIAYPSQSSCSAVVMPPVVLFWFTLSAANLGSMTVKVLNRCKRFLDNYIMRSITFKFSTLLHSFG